MCVDLLCCRAVLCLVLGCIYRSKGGVGLQPTLKGTVEALVAVASRPVGIAHIWALHGLWLVAGAVGPGYGPHVRQSLQLALELLVSACSRCYCSPYSVLSGELAQEALVWDGFSCGRHAEQPQASLWDYQHGSELRNLSSVIV